MTHPTYEIKQGDTLYDLCRTRYGDPQLWPRLAGLNRAVIVAAHKKRFGRRPYRSASPHEIYPGTQLVVPATADDPTLRHAPRWGVDL